LTPFYKDSGLGWANSSPTLSIINLMGWLQQVASNDWVEQKSHTQWPHPNVTPKKFQPFISIVLRFQSDFQLNSPTDTKIKFLAGFLAVLFFRTHAIF